MVVLYTTHCPRCQVLEKKLQSKNIDYSVVEDKDEILNKGFMTVPVLEINGETYDFGTAVKWIGEQ